MLPKMFDIVDTPDVGLAATGTLRYPPTLAAGLKFPYTLFMPYKRPTGTASSTSTAIGQALYDRLPAPEFAIALPTPANAMKTQYQANYDTIDIGQAVGAALQTNSDLGNSADTAAFFRGLGTAAGSALENAGISLAQQAAELIGTSSQAVNMFVGKADNPYTENVFKNVGFRSHSFAYTFMPKNLNESETLDRIIRAFKFAMLPEPSSAGYFEFPYEFQILHSIQNTTFLLMPSVLETFDVDFGGGTDTLKLFNNQYPAKISLNMTFKEMVLLSRDRIDSTQAPSTPGRYRF